MPWRRGFSSGRARLLNTESSNRVRKKNHTSGPLLTSRDSVVFQTTPFNAMIQGRDLGKTVKSGDSRRRLRVLEEPRDQKERLRVPSGRDLGHDSQKVTSFHTATVGTTTPFSIHKSMSVKGSKKREGGDLFEQDWYRGKR